MDKPLGGRTALVTGGARRIGAAIVRALADAGATVWIHCNRSRADAEALLATLGPRAGGILSADLANPGEREALFAEAVRRSGGIDVWVNNAALFLPDSSDPGALAAQRAVNRDAPLAFLDALAAARRPACVLHLLDARIALPPASDAPFARYADPSAPSPRPSPAPHARWPPWTSASTASPPATSCPPKRTANAHGPPFCPAARHRTMSRAPPCSPPQPPPSPDKSSFSTPGSTSPPAPEPPAPHSVGMFPRSAAMAAWWVRSSRTGVSAT